jgi:uncharacterized protein YceH (UPF0502 family)
MEEQQQSTDAGALPFELTTAEARVLACLIEKEATTPDQYPLTANAVQLACNQKTAREPLMDLELGAVGHALRTLEDKRLVRVVHGSRALRYDHRTDDVYRISPEQRVLLALLMLRGPQTVAELLARSERLHRFADAEQVRTVLDRLSSRQPALVVRIGRGPGQREDRYMHLLSGTPDLSAFASAAAAAPAERAARADPALLERIERLEAEVAALREAVDRLGG